MPVQAVALLDPRFQADHLVAVLVPLHLHDARITFQHLDLFAKLAQFLVGMVAFLGVCGVHFEVRNLGREFTQGDVLFGNLTFQIGNTVLVVALVRVDDLLVQVLDTAVALGDLFVGRGEFAFLSESWPLRYSTSISSSAFVAMCLTPHRRRLRP